jgi:glucose/arabinose dehydrogenase
MNINHKKFVGYISKCFLLVAFIVLLFACNSPKDHKEQNFVRKVIDTNPPVTPLSPEESIKKIQLPPGYHVELVASEPMVQEPVAIAWDGNGRMYVAEMNTYMKDALGSGEYEPTSRIKLLEDTDGDGKMDKYSIFIDSLVLPRVILPVGNKLLVGITNIQHIWSYEDTNGDGKADKKEIVFRNDIADVRNL